MINVHYRNSYKFLIKYNVLLKKYNNFKYTTVVWVKRFSSCGSRANTEVLAAAFENCKIKADTENTDAPFRRLPDSDLTLCSVNVI